MTLIYAVGRALHRSKPARFLAVGVLNTLFGYGVYLAGLSFGLEPTLALAIATVIGATFNYFTTGRIVFGHCSIDRLVVFFGAYAMLYVVNATAIHVLLRTGTSPPLAQGILLPVMAVLSFFVFRTFVFRPVQIR